MDSCVFCDIVAGVVPAHRLLEDRHTLAFLNLAPATTGHALVVPDAMLRVCGIWMRRSMRRVARAVSRVAGMLHAALAPAGMNLVHATGVAAWQSVFHFHVHVVPRYESDRLQVMWQAAPAPGEELDAVQERVLAARHAAGS